MNLTRWHGIFFAYECGGTYARVRLCSASIQIAGFSFLNRMGLKKKRFATT